MKKLKVVELFAGVGGFRYALEKTNKYEIIWSNQFEPLQKLNQFASDIYVKHWGNKNHINKDINEIKISDIPDCDVLVGGFPCQDYSVANRLGRSGGIEGKKGVLWWNIHSIIRKKINKPKYLILENVDRLLKSPVKQRGRDFAIMLKCLVNNGYIVEWRVINAAEYGFPQKRKRVFILGYHKTSSHYEKIKSNLDKWVRKSGTLSKAFPHEIIGNIKHLSLRESITTISKSFNLNKSKSVFEESGIIVNSKVLTFKSVSIFSGKRKVLKDILINKKVDEKYYIKKNDEAKWRKAKGKVSKVRKLDNGFKYNFKMGKMKFPDDINLPSRTIITSEGKASPDRSKHVIVTKHGLRRLTPIEIERLNGFPDDYTKLEGVTDTWRGFFMGNALVVGVVEKIGDNII